MSGKSKYPDLQKKFEDAIHYIILHANSKDERISGPNILDKIRNNLNGFGVSDDEFEDLKFNFKNYIQRAKNTGFINGHGPKGGYSLSSQEPAVNILSTSNSSIGLGGAPSAARSHWESFLHFAASIALSENFSSRVYSLPTSVDQVKWGNPDMLMLRASPIACLSDLDNLLDLKIFRKVDATPECILSSIELKAGLGRVRSAMFQAISEAAANSRWANEGWLVFIDWYEDDSPLEEDFLSLARSAEIGIIEIRLINGGNGSKVFKVIEHQKAIIKPTLRIDEISSERVGILKEAQEIITRWNSGDQTFLDTEGDKNKMRIILEQAINNLRRQKGFIRSGNFADQLRPLADEDIDYTANVLSATLITAALAAERDVGCYTDVATDFISALEEIHVARDVKYFSAIMNDMVDICDKSNK